MADMDCPLNLVSFHKVFSAARTTDAFTFDTTLSVSSKLVNKSLLDFENDHIS
jgi:hypothetical protein